MVTVQMLWGLKIQFIWPVTLFSPRRRQIIHDDRAQVTPRYLVLRAELDRRRLQLLRPQASTQTPTPREVAVEVVPAEGFELEIEGALTAPFVTADDMNRWFERTVADVVRDELFIPDDAPLVLIVTDEHGAVRRIEQAKRTE
ncbi:hypothetical protein ACFZDG_11020 [Kitasatospora xanthocidica]|uniref:hypothetical protein n=1 Tax=Kitasatospora xanthocidica TaxID=83382 RepID=UPI0036E03AF2